MDAGQILDGLNEAQRAAVTSEASVLQVLAPPGSGKTKTLTARVAYLISKHGLDPRKIIVCTFTNKAANEMKERIAGFLGQDVAKKLILGTFHSISKRFLSSYGRFINLDEKFSIADTSDQKAILGRIIKRLSLNVETTFSKTVQSRISSCKSRGQTVEQYVTSSKAADKHEFAQVWGEYEEHLRVSNLLDFDDLLMRCCELLRLNAHCVGGIQAVLVDEFQDTNNIQYELMELFAQHKHVITIVGDPDQSIYGWRNAEIKNLKKMRDQYPDTHVEILSQNYRTSGAILQAAQEVIEQDEARENKKLMPTHSIGVPAVLRRLPTAEAEAEWVILEIKRTMALTGGLLDLNDYAILLRSAMLSRQIETALGKAGIAYKMVGGKKFYDRMEVKLVLDYLRVISHPEHNDALIRVLNTPKRGIGDTSQQALINEAGENKVSLWGLVTKIARGRRKSTVKLSPQAEKGLTAFVNVIVTAQKRLRNPPQDKDTLLDFLGFVLEKVGIAKYLKEEGEKDNKGVDYETRMANVQQLVQQASEFSVALQNGDLDEEALFEELEELNANTSEEADEAGEVLQSVEKVRPGSTEDALVKFLGNVALATDAQRTEEDGPPKPMVTISTIHAAKGLEWPVVFIPAAYNGSIPHSRAEDNDEERRLLYVAMTRAQSLLYLSCPLKDQSKNDVTLSPFLSKQGMDGYFAKSGVNIGFDVVKELAVILRRNCPSANFLGEALITYEFPKDNKWPESGILDEEEHKDWGMLGANIDNKYNRPSFKRPKLGMQSSFDRESSGERAVPVPGFAFATTMSKSDSFSSARTTIPVSGFVSARDVKIEEPERKKSIPALSRESSSTETTKQPEKRKLKKVESGQGSLLSFWGAKPQPSTLSREASVESDPVSTITPSFTGPPSAMDKTAEAQRFMPTKGTPPIDEAKENKVDHDRSDIKERPVPETRPATTFHTTSMSNVVSSDRLRRTLGVRRTMNGWAQRVHK